MTTYHAYVEVPFAKAVQVVTSWPDRCDNLVETCRGCRTPIVTAASASNRASASFKVTLSSLSQGARSKKFHAQ